MKTNKRKLVRPNVVPILDAVFIFIFFLLMSAQFVDIFEIPTDVPKVSEVSEKSLVKPLNLTLKITSDKILVTTGVEEKLYQTIQAVDGQYDLDTLNKTLIKIKADHFKEKSIVLRPNSKIPYKKIIAIVDAVRKSNFGQVSDNFNKAESLPTNELFTQVIFETYVN